jgi:serine/threonine-protein kinase RsbW
VSPSLEQARPLRGERHVPEPAADVRYERRLPAVIPSIAHVRHELDAVLVCAAVPGRRREDIALAVTEATTNVVLHAYRDAEPPGRLEVVAVISGGTLRVTVRDWGCGMRPRLDSPGSGFGLSLMGQLADAVAVRTHRIGGGTSVSLRFGAVTAAAARSST